MSIGFAGRLCGADFSGRGPCGCGFAALKEGGAVSAMLFTERCGRGGVGISLTAVLLHR